MENQNNNNEQPKNDNPQQPKKGLWSKIKGGLWYAVAVIAGAGVGAGATYGAMKNPAPANPQ